MGKLYERDGMTFESTREEITYPKLKKGDDVAGTYEGFYMTPERTATVNGKKVKIGAQATFRLRRAAGDLIGLNGTGNLPSRMAALPLKSTVLVQYHGKNDEGYHTWEIVPGQGTQLIAKSDQINFKELLKDFVAGRVTASGAAASESATSYEGKFNKIA